MNVLSIRCLVVQLSLALVVVFPAGAADEAGTKFKNLNDLIGGAKDAKLTLYEGLPHQMFEKKKLEEELKNKKTVSFNSYPFYAETLELKDEDAKKLAGLFVEKSFEEFGGEKKCGGFHPDYLLEWKVGDDVYRAHLCFGCHEMKVYGPKNGLRCDIKKEALESFQSILKPYCKNRPKK